ncbi:hypothetical protein [Flavihumibacter petaseus]|uniref:Uncharacterized protein n=1 Tax=Flavihumibacter petaseus NBRC 106054 TaxID=1220578 RepID=A0A0E9N1A6_9BACT|nr:hypothetical protein [Flavihumibacter petaseus]GAO43812.1 hypothetical protein FPE01S_02_09180 [Flavihumibacter petaseus NBRC 106054]
MGNVPSSRPQLTKEAALEKVAAFSVPEKVILLGIRGYYRDTMGEKGKNDRGIYDDAIFVIAPDYFASFNANTDPTVKRNGVSVLKPGLHYYKKGRHRISRPPSYPAFRPDTPGELLPVTRDDIGDSMGIAINIHKGGYNSTSSEGCQTIYPSQWEAFQTKVYQLMDEAGQTRIPYILIEQA